MSFKAYLNIFEQDYTVLHCSYELEQITDKEGQPASVVRGGQIFITVESSGDTKLIEAMSSDDMTNDGLLTFQKKTADAKMKELKFEQAYVVKYKETFDATGDGPMTEEFTLSARKISIGEMEFENQWVDR